MDALHLIVIVPTLIVSLASVFTYKRNAMDIRINDHKNKQNQNGQSDGSGCLYPTDLVFLLDGSESVSESSFLQQKAFVVVNTNTLQMMAPSLKQVHVGVEVFSYDVNVITQLDKPTLPDVFNNFVLAAHQPRDGTRTNVALRTLRYMVSQQSRKNSLLKAVLITDGYSKDVAKTIEEARRAKNIGVEFIFIGIGNSIKKEEVAGMVDDYSKVFLLKSFDDLAGISDHVREAICSGMPRIRYNEASSKKRELDGVHKTADSLLRKSSEPKKKTFPISETSSTSTLYTTSKNKSIAPTRNNSFPATTPPTSITTITTASTITTPTTSQTTTTISSTIQTTTTTTTPSSTTSTPVSMTTTQPASTLQTTTRRINASNHFTLMPLTLLGGFGGSETLMDIFRGSRYYSPKSKTSYGMRIPFPFIMPRAQVTISHFKAGRTTLSPYRYLANKHNNVYITTLKPTHTKTMPIITSSTSSTESSKPAVVTTTPATFTTIKQPNTFTRTISTNLKTIVTTTTTTTTTTSTENTKSITTITTRTTTPVNRHSISMKMSTVTDSRCSGKSAVDGEPSHYYEQDGPLLHKRSCPVGVAFDPTTCTCILHTPFVTSECRPDLVLTFSRGIKDISGGNTIMSKTSNVKIIDNIATFSGGHLETWRFINVFQKSITIRFRFFPNSNREPLTKRPLIGNCNVDSRKSYGIELNEVSGTVTFSLATSERVAVSDLPYREGWNSVLMIYNGNILYCQVNDHVNEEVLTARTDIDDTEIISPSEVYTYSRTLIGREHGHVIEASSIL